MREHGHRSIRFPALLAAALIALLGSSSHAQERRAATLLLGASIGLDAGWSTGRYPIFAGSPECGELGDGTVSTRSLGATVVVPELFGDHVGLRGSLAWSSATERFSLAPPPLPIYDSETALPIMVERAILSSTDISMLRLDLLAETRVGDCVTLDAGPWIGYRFASSTTVDEEILSPDDLSFPDGRASRPLIGTTPLTTQPLACGVVAGGSYGFTLWSNVSLRADLFARIDLTSPVNEFDRLTYSVGGGLSVLFDVSPHVEAPVIAIVEPQQPTRDTVAPPPARLTASIALYGVDDRGTAVERPSLLVREVIYNRYVPFLPVIFFDSASTLPSRYATARDLLTLSDTTSTLDPLAINHAGLAIVGRRLLANPEATIILFGGTSRDETQELGLKRARTVRSYLSRAWGIDEKRMAVRAGFGAIARSNEATADGRAENRRVEIASPTAEIVAPVATETTLREFDPPTIKVRPSVTADAGVKHWTITLSHAGHPVARYSSDESESLRREEVAWRVLAESMDSSMAPLIGELIVEDSAGNVVAAHDEMPLSLERDIRLPGIDRSTIAGRMRLEYRLIGFNYDSPSLPAGSSAMLKRVAASVREGARITVTGYTDRLGEQQENLRLSDQRASGVAEVLRELLRARGMGGTVVDVRAGGVETVRFPNDLPEGRMLSRGAGIMIEQDVAKP